MSAVTPSATWRLRRAQSLPGPRSAGGTRKRKWRVSPRRSRIWRTEGLATVIDPGPGVADRWPTGYRCALSVTIDVDGRYGETNFRPDDMYWTSQTAYDPRGTERLLAVLADRETLATFCWVGRAAEDHPLHVRAAVAAGHVIALHSWDHRAYNRMTADEQRADMERSLEALKRISGTAPVGHKTASWRYDEATHRLAQELGLLWVMDEPGGDLPYLIQPDTAFPHWCSFLLRVGMTTTRSSSMTCYHPGTRSRCGAMTSMSCATRAG